MPNAEVPLMVTTPLEASSVVAADATMSLNFIETP